MYIMYIMIASVCMAIIFRILKRNSLKRFMFSREFKDKFALNPKDPIVKILIGIFVIDSLKSVNHHSAFIEPLGRFN